MVSLSQKCNFSSFIPVLNSFSHSYISEDITEKTLCKKTLDADGLARLAEAIEDLYYFEFVIGI